MFVVDCVVNCTLQGSTEDEVPPDDGKHVMLTVATIIYSFEGCGAILPTESSMQNPDNFYKVCTYCFATYLVVYATIGGLGVSSFRFDEVLPADDRGSISVHLWLAPERDHFWRVPRPHAAPCRPNPPHAMGGGGGGGYGGRHGGRYSG